jgi:hypothetical protein
VPTGAQVKAGSQKDRSYTIEVKDQKGKKPRKVAVEVVRRPKKV